MTEPEMKTEVETGAFTDDLSDEALDRGADGLFSAGGWATGGGNCHSGS